MRVVGTAGHVDHGKSSLVRALTGIDPDRLREEKEREMTIDLGFAWMDLPSGQTVSIVDVPGHEDFIKNMLAGVGGIDVALFVVAADEGVMPQTREHLAILDLLDVENGVIALTKQDLIEDQEWLELVEEELREQLAGTTLQHAPIVPVSARTGYGLQALREELDRVVAASPPARDINRPRLSIDRVFSIAGFGTVVTGTLMDGKFHVGDEVEILPDRLRSRIRGLQTHKAKVEEAVPGSRVAINLAGLSTDALKRGDVVATPGWLRPTQLVDVSLRLLKSAPRPLEHDTEVDFYVGAAVVQARVRVLGREALDPGEIGWAQLVLSQPLAVVKGDRYILRFANATIGGGVVVDPHPARRHRRFRPEVIARLETLARGTPEEIVLETLTREQPQEAEALLHASALQREIAETALASLLQSGQVLALAASGLEAKAVIAANKVLLTLAGWNALVEKISGLLGDYHRAYPLRGGMPRGELRSRLNLAIRVFNDLVAHAIAAGRLAETPNGDLKLPEHEIRFTPAQQARVNALLQSFAASPYAPPSVAASEEQVGPGVLAALLERGDLVKVSSEVLFAGETYKEMVARITDHLRRDGKVTVAQVRDLFNTSRKYALGLLEYLDDQQITRRIGDERVLRSG